MRLSISNIAWDVTEDAAVADLLQRKDIDAIDIAPGKYFPEPTEATPEQMAEVRRWWNQRGISIVGMQSLLFGTLGLNLFGSADARDAMLRHLEAVCRVAAGVGAQWLVFGSPKNRDRSGLTDQQTEQIALPFFRKLGSIAQRAGVTVCLEPNPEHYGANFLTRSDDTAAMVRLIDHPAIRMQLDTGSLALSDEDPAAILRNHGDLIGHIHASEPDLMPLGDRNAPHAKAAQSLRQCLPGSVVTIEMVATREEPHLQSIERAIDNAILHYRPDATAAA
jgi:sugar phosphate isomerase/epimerase